MKRTNLVLDESVLIEAQRLAGERTYSATVIRALKEFVQRAKARQILSLADSGTWSGDLAAMRDDRPRTRSSRRGPR
jgi:Arc/MetJ family transcription regulator